MSSASTSPTSVAGLVKTVRGLFFFGTLVKNPDKLDSVFEMRDSMTSPETVVPVAEALRTQSPRAAAAFRERPRLGRLDVASLARLPAHTLGGAYGRFLQENGLDPSAIPTLKADEDWEYLSAHLYETHDLWHVLTGFGVDVAGEGGLQGFYAAQIPGGLASALLSAVLLNNATLNSHVETERRMSAIAEGWLMGKRAESLFGFRFADRFEDSLEDIRRELGIVPVGDARHAAADGATTAPSVAALHGPAAPASAVANVRHGGSCGRRDLSSQPIVVDPCARFAARLSVRGEVDAGEACDDGKDAGARGRGEGGVFLFRREGSSS